MCSSTQAMSPTPYISFPSRPAGVTASSELPADRVRVAESGIHGTDDLDRLHRAGYGAFLVGEHLVRAEDPEAAVRSLLGRGGGDGDGC